MVVPELDCQDYTEESPVSGWLMDCAFVESSDLGNLCTGRGRIGLTMDLLLPGCFGMYDHLTCKTGLLGT